jgi:glutathione S-transferase
MSRWTLYTAPGTCALATHAALREAGADFDVVRLDFGTAEQRGASYLALNPKGRVPALVTEDGVLTETPALLLFAPQRFPAAGLAPLDDPFALARMQEWTSWLAATMHVAHAHGRRGARWAGEPAAHAGWRPMVPKTLALCDAFVFWLI